MIYKKGTVNKKMGNAHLFILNDWLYYTTKLRKNQQKNKVKTINKKYKKEVMQLESPLATPQPNLWQDSGINRATCQTFCRKDIFGMGGDIDFYKKCYIFDT